MQTGCVCVCFFVYGKCVCSFEKAEIFASRFQESLILLPGSVGELYFANCLWIQVPKNIIKSI